MTESDEKTSKKEIDSFFASITSEIKPLIERRYAAKGKELADVKTSLFNWAHDRRLKILGEAYVFSKTEEEKAKIKIEIITEVEKSFNKADKLRDKIFGNAMRNILIIVTLTLGFVSPLFQATLPKILETYKGSVLGGDVYVTFFILGFIIFLVPLCALIFLPPDKS